jgi:hypothetical protein
VRTIMPRSPPRREPAGAASTYPRRFLGAVFRK